MQLITINKDVRCIGGLDWDAECWFNG